MKEPKIRFKGFKGEWEIDKIGNFSTSFSGGTPTAGNSAYYGGNIPFIRSGEIHEDKTELSLTEKGYNNSSAKIVEKGTLLYALYGATSGDVAISKIRGAINQAILAIIPYKSVETDFLADFLLCNKNKIVGELLQGGQGNLSGALVKDINVTYPCLSEQRAIATYFQHLDALIQSTTKKIESLKQVKAASLQSMFPQEGATTPRVRFKGFEGEWEKVRASNVFKTFNEKNRPDLPVLSATQDRGMVTREAIGYNIFHDKSNEATYKHILPGQFIIHLRSFQGGFAHSSIEGIASPAYTIMEFKDKTRHFDLYWKYIFMSKEFIKRLELITYGIRDGRSISFEEFSEMYFTVPSYEEQKKIASYITNLDRQITLHTQRLEKLKQIKTACLDEMFV